LKTKAMKTIIKITGQIQGNFRLLTHLQRDAEKVEHFFTDHILTFRTKREAVKALRQANKRLRSLEPDFYREGVRYFPGWQLLYDASKAEII